MTALTDTTHAMTVGETISLDAPVTVKFNDLYLAEAVLKALAAANYTKPTPIQAQAIPTVLDGRDLFGIAQTGTGKTAAFALPIITRLVKDRRRPARKGCRALVLSPTRELATQIAESFQTYGKFAGITVTTVFGGVGAVPQIRALSRGVDVVVATPGRLQDLMRSGHCDLSNTDILVLDEADQMLDLGFLKPIRAISSQTAPQRQSLFFSATLPDEIEKLAREMLRNPVSVRVTPVSSTAERVEQQILLLERARKPSMLAEILRRTDVERTLVFARTKRGADRVVKNLESNGIQARAIHGNKSQGQRQDALKAFRAGRVGVLVATDIAARGIDIPAVSHVVNYELPETPEAYVHRIGRTARAGREGTAISLCEPAERKLLRAIERLTRQTIASERITTAAPANEPRMEPVPSREEDLERQRNRRPERASRGKNQHTGSEQPRRKSQRQGSQHDGSQRHGSQGKGRAHDAASGTEQRRERPARKHRVAAQDHSGPQDSRGRQERSNSQDEAPNKDRSERQDRAHRQDRPPRHDRPNGAPAERTSGKRPAAASSTKPRGAGRANTAKGKARAGAGRNDATGGQRPPRRKSA